MVDDQEFKTFCCMMWKDVTLEEIDNLLKVKDFILGLMKENAMLQKQFKDADFAQVNTNFSMKLKS